MQHLKWNTADIKKFAKYIKSGVMNKTMRYILNNVIEYYTNTSRVQLFYGKAKNETLSYDLYTLYLAFNDISEAKTYAEHYTYSPDNKFSILHGVRVFSNLFGGEIEKEFQIEPIQISTPTKNNIRKFSESLNPSEYTYTPSYSQQPTSGKNSVRIDDQR